MDVGGDELSLSLLFEELADLHEEVEKTLIAVRRSILFILGMSGLVALSHLVQMWT